MTSRLADACGEVTRWLPAVEDLIAQPDDDGTHTRTQPATSPPWNAAAAYVVLDIHHGARRLEEELRDQVAGHRGPPRGGSAANTAAALHAVAQLGYALGVDAADLAAVIVERWVTAAQQLPAIDEAPRWERIRVTDCDGLPPRCPYCLTFSLRVAVAVSVVACWMPGCVDGRGARPTATMEIGAASGQPMLVWADGMVQIAP